MRRPHCQTIASLTALLVCAVISQSKCNLAAAEFRLKNGARFTGSMLVMNSLNGRAISKAEQGQIKDKDPEPHLISRVDNEWQRIYFPALQLEPKSDSLLTDGVRFEIRPPKRAGNRLVVTSVGSLSYVEPFSDFGVRRVTIQTPQKPMDVIQAITVVTPDHVMVDSLNCNWKFGLSTKSIPFETLDKLLKKQIDQNDPQPRFNIARLYIQSQFFQQANRELQDIRRDFPDKAEAVDRFQADLLNYFGSEILSRLEQRKRAGQHELVQVYAQRLIEQPLTGAVLNDVKKFLRNYDDSRQTIDRVKLRLIELQSKVDDSSKAEKLQPLRSDVNDHLNFETLARMDSFLKAEDDTRFDAGQRLGLAYSGWLVGAANAVPDLDQAIRLWEARQLLVEYLQSEDPAIHRQIQLRLESTESLGVVTVLSLINSIPPQLDSTGLHAGEIHRIDANYGSAARYSVMLPAEYSPQHEYPLLIALHSRIHSPDDTVKAWAGDSSSPTHGNQRGYIVISPDYTEAGATEYNFSAAAHQIVLDCLTDARRRFSVDSDRVYLAGHGMGADAAFDIGMSHADEFAGVLPIGGNATHFCRKLWENASQTAWYVVGNGYDVNGNRDRTSNQIFDEIFKRGHKFDFMLVEYQGRRGEAIIDEIPKFYDWMELTAHVRQPLPKQFKMLSLRKTDNRFFWVTGVGLNRDYTTADFSKDLASINPMKFDVYVSPGANVINLSRNPTDNFTLRLTNDLIDFDKELTVKLDKEEKFRGFVKRDLGAALEEYRSRGDRKRIPLAVISPSGRNTRKTRTQ